MKSTPPLSSGETRSENSQVSSSHARAGVRPPPLPTSRSGASGNHRLPPRLGNAASEVRSEPWQMAEPYKLIRPVALGGLCYEAQNTTTGRRAFVRLYPDVHELAEMVGEFAELSQLACPHVVRVLDVGVAPLPVPIGYVVMEYVDGPSLQAVLEERGSLAPHVALRLVAQVLAALEEAHRRGLAHGRLTPDAVLLGRGTLGEPVARLTHFKLGPAAAGGLSPDVVASDIEAAAQLLIQALFGRKFAATEHAQLTALTRSSPGLDAVLFSALGWSPARFCSATQFGSALARLPVVTREDGKRRAVSVIDAACVGAASSTPDLFPSRLRESASRPMVIWVLSDDAHVGAQSCRIAFEELAATCEVAYLNGEAQAIAREQLAAGDLQLPWVVVFGGAHVARSEPLLALLASCREVSCLLVSEAMHADAIARAARLCSVDGCVGLPSAPDEITRQVVRLAERTRAKSRAYDQLRRDLRCAFDELGELSRAAAAEDVPEVPSSRTWSVRVAEAMRQQESTHTATH